MDQKIFCVGLSKTGTHSLTAALNQLGYRAVHFQYTRKVFSYRGDDLVIHHQMFQSYDAFLDTPIARIYRYLDQKYPRSRFILTVRDPQAWEHSFEDQFGDHSPTRNSYSRRLHQELYGSPTFESPLNKNQFISHNQSVVRHFRSRPEKLLIMDICGGEGWDRLCPFVGRPVPDSEFPARYVRQVDTVPQAFGDGVNSERKDLR